MYNRILRISSFLLFAVIGFAANAQEYSKNIYSPSTLYGIGQLSSQGFSNSRGMGDAGIATRSRFMINHLNPAALTAQDTTTFIVDFGVEGNNIYASSNSTKSSFNGFNFDHLSVAFPISKRFFTALTFQPYSQVGYRISYDETNPDILANVGNVTYEYNGKGGINIGQVGLGFKITEGLSVGANLNVYFGSIDRNYNTIFDPSATLYSSSYEQTRVMVANVGFTTGLNYSKKIGNDKFMNVGLIYNPKLNINATYEELSTTANVLDTNSYVNTKVHFGIPAKYGVGLSFGKYETFNVALDYTFTQWEKVDPLDKFTEYTNTNSMRLGFELLPNVRDFRNYFNRVTYRAGVRYSDLYYKINGTKSSDMALSLGLGLPIKGLSYINTSFEFGQRGTKVDGGIKETYFTFTVGLSLFDRWFLKPMFN